MPNWNVFAYEEQPLGDLKVVRQLQRDNSIEATTIASKLSKEFDLVILKRRTNIS